ncbi:ABC transporter permease [Bacillus aerolatus]|uniref:ABC transporter permease n=1 Tax=Bacillus aerolatus TaxID=2653354 RepID=A0A6I1FCB8_9BACI|nr:ABC transporter permease [Bacillus aerolatus]KAB7704943.1 ABC transporter permease [Bacillus aerolatus]
MNNFWMILSQSYINKFKTKAFIVTTLLIAVVIIAAANMEQIFSYFDDEEKETKIAVIDKTGTMYEPFKAQLAVIADDLIAVQTDKTENELKDEVEKGTYKGYLLLDRTADELPAATYKAENIANSETTSDIQQALQTLKTMEVAGKFQLTNEQIQMWNAPAAFETVALAKNAKSEEELMQAQALVYILLFFIYMSVIMYANMIASEVAIEKSSRVMEILISSVSPVKQMFAKIIGIGLLGLTQMGIWIAFAYVALSNQSEGSIVSLMGLKSVSASMMVYAVVLFILGYFLYATIAALLGSLVSRLEDVQQMMMPLTFLVMIGFFISMYGLSNPESTFITVTSYIPFFTPMIMFVRIGLLSIPLWEVALGFGILLAAIFVFGVIGARIYKGGVLMYGKSNSLKDMKKALEMSKDN